MENLLVLDSKDYNDDMSVFEKYAVRAIIIKDTVITMQKSKEGEYKIPGGTVEETETYITALIREVIEETGLVINPTTITEIGEIKEVRQDYYNKGQKYICHSLYYKCEVFDEIVETKMTDNEISSGYKLEWETIDKIYATNMKLHKEAWTMRDTRFFKLILDNIVRL